MDNLYICYGTVHVRFPTKCYVNTFHINHLHNRKLVLYVLRLLKICYHLPFNMDMYIIVNTHEIMTHKAVDFSTCLRVKHQIK